MGFRITIAILGICFFLQNAAIAETKNRLEDLMLWKLTEELHLNGQDEKKLTDIYKQAYEKKILNQQALSKLIDNQSKTKTRIEKSKFISDYKKLLSEYNEINIEEVSKVEKAFGAEKAAQYILVKLELATKIKSLIVADKAEKTDKSEKEDKAEQKATLPDPKIIEE